MKLKHVRDLDAAFVAALASHPSVRATAVDELPDGVHFLTGTTTNPGRIGLYMGQKSLTASVDALQTLIRACHASAVATNAHPLLFIEQCSIFQALFSRLQLYASAYDIPTIPVRDPAQAVRILVRTTRKKRVRKHDKVVTLLSDPRELRALIEQATCRVPHVSKKRARGVLERFGCLSNLMRASRPELTRIPGVGVDTAKVVHTFFNTDEPASPSSSSSDSSSSDSD